MIDQRPGLCVHDYIWDAVKGQPGFKQYDKAAFCGFVRDPMGRCTTREIKQWHDSKHQNVSIYALDPWFIVCKIELWQEGFRLCFQVKDNHFCPILNENIIIVTAHGSNILKHMDTIKWSDQHKQKTIVKCLKMEDYWTAIESEDKIWIVLPRGTDMKKVLVMTMKKMRVHTSSIQRSMSSNTCKRPINIESGSKATGRDL